MAYAKLNPMYEYVKGAASKPKKIDGHNHGTYQILQHREAATTNPNCQRVYVKAADAYNRSTEPTARELQIRARFSAISALIAQKRRDPVEMQTIQAAFLAQKDDANGYKTLTKYLWATLGDDYDKDHPQG